MSANLRLTKGTLAWLLLSVFAVVVPHVRHLPIWVMVLVIFVLIWRIQIYRSNWSIPNRWGKLCLVITCIGGLHLNYHSLFSLEPMVALLIVSLTLKLLEMYRVKDATTVILLGFFTTSAQFLFGQTVLDFSYAIICFVLLVSAMAALNVVGQTKLSNSVFPTALRLTVQCIPIMLVLFLLFPRIASLWAVSLPQNTAQTGVSDTMAPGDITRLTKGGGKAFTVTFDGDIPANKELYWRGIVLSDFDGKSWTINKWRQDPLGGIVKWANHSVPSKALDWYYTAQPIGNPLSYEVILEATQQPWLFALPMAEIKLNRAGVTRDFTQITETPISKRICYRVQSSLRYKIDHLELPERYRKRNLHLPEGFNSQTIKVAKNWRKLANNDTEIVNRFLSMIANEYTYTLEPKQLGKNTVDDFLWTTKEGYCEHFASAFVVFMRAAGIPARVVAGYQGGEVIEDFLQVSQTDAHAWAEIWIKNQGWQRIDPTAAIAPERVEDGIRSVFERSVLNPLSMEAYRHIYLINNFRLQLDVLNYKWQKFVLNYNTDSQFNLLERLFGTRSWLISTLVLVVTIAATLGLIALLTIMLRKNTEKPSPALTVIKPLLKKAERAGHKREKGESLTTFINRLAKIYPDNQNRLNQIALLFEQVTYGKDRTQLNQLKTNIKSCKL